MAKEKARNGKVEASVANLVKPNFRNFSFSDRVWFRLNEVSNFKD